MKKKAFVRVLFSMQVKLGIRVQHVLRSDDVKVI